jgi:hypothetical protein
MGIFAPARDHVGQAYERRVAHAMVEENAITRFHVSNRTKSLRIPDAIPYGSAIALQLFHGISFGICFSQKIRTSGRYSIYH